MTNTATISEQEVKTAQATWANGVLHIGASDEWETAHSRATEMVQSLYDLSEGPILFCPTLAAERQFRHTLEDAVSYFVGRCDAHPEDQGFALKSWTGIRFENSGMICGSDTAMAMGNYFFALPDGEEVKAEFSFVYSKDSSGALRIRLHHSSLPYSG